MRRIIQLSLPLLVSVSISVNAQKIDYNNIDYTYLEQLIKTGIDSLRQEKSARPFE